MVAGAGVFSTLAAGALGPAPDPLVEALHLIEERAGAYKGKRKYGGAPTAASPRSARGEVGVRGAHRLQT